MKRSVLVITLIAGTAIIMGLILGGVGYAIATRDDTAGAPGRGNVTRMEYEGAAEDFTSIVIRDVNNSISLRPSADDRIHITYYDTEYGEYALSESGGTLRLEWEEVNWYSFNFFWNFSFEETTMIVEIPREYAGELQARSTNGRVEAEDLTVNGALELRTTNGTITARRIKSLQECIVDTTNGRVTIEGAQAPRLTAASTSGVISAENIEADEIDLHTTNGRITLTDAVSKGKLSIRTTNGAIEVAHVDGQDITLRTTNSAIRGTLAGKMEDYSITSRTTNGSNSLPNGTSAGARKLDVSTSNGSIKIDFEE